LLNFGARAFLMVKPGDAVSYKYWKINSSHVVRTHPANGYDSEADIYITDPPYADAINYHEITEFFIAWIRKNHPATFKDWTWDSRRALAIRGEGDEFKKGMVEAYCRMADRMPPNGLQIVMFTHQDAG